MQTEDLKYLHKLRSEIRGLELLIRDMSGQQVEDAVTGSSPDFPYGKHKIVIRGTNVKQINRLRVKLFRKKKQLEKAIEEAESFLEIIDDPVDRNILRLRCEMGLEWKEVASRTGSTENACKKRFSRMMKEIDKDGA